MCNKLIQINCVKERFRSVVIVPFHKIEQIFMVADSFEGFTLSRGAIHGDELHGHLHTDVTATPVLVGGLLHAEAEPKRGFLKRDAAPRLARELGAQHDLTWPQPEEDVQNDVPAGAAKPSPSPPQPAGILAPAGEVEVPSRRRGGWRGTTTTTSVIQHGEGKGDWRL